MSASIRHLRLPNSLFLLAAAVTVAAIGCGGRADEPAPDALQTNASESKAGEGGGAASKECAGRACGVDCTPAGSDEPFNCNSAGQCVATGQPLDCKVCPAFLGDCRAGDEPADLDGDGCTDGCKPKACPAFLGDCRAGDEPADLDGDGCTDGCKPIGAK